MIYAENIFVFLIAPFLVGLFFLKGESKRFVAFLITGTVVCLLSSYINSFFASVFSMSSNEAIVKITPIIEEIMKALPLIFIIVIFSPKKENLLKYAIGLGIGFATFENCCYVVNHGADDFYFVLIRGFAVGIMHIFCGIILGFTLGFGENQKHFSWIGVFASVAICIGYHSLYNLLVSGNGMWQLYGFFMPFVTVATVIIFKNLIPIIKNK